MTAAVEVEAPAVVTAPCLIDDMTAEDYHGDPVPGGSLSSSGARKLLRPSCPALYRWEQDNPQPPRKTFEFGHAAHKTVLGDGPDLEVIDQPNYLTKAAKQARDEARAAGLIPLLRHEYEQVQAMADEIRRHPVAGPLFTPGTGIAEQSGFWQDPATGVWCRFRPDWRRHRGDNDRLILVDYKTTTDVSPAALQKTVYDYGYHAQGAWYRDGATALGLAGDIEPAFLFAFQMKTPPYLVHLVELDMPALTFGAARNRRAREIYAECQATGNWPGFNDAITYLSLPPWGEKRDEEDYL
ncbi:PD-(D/E)XK nuclease-like domain-containing protein [Streptomyces albidoflavus]|uniref:PD-(D/E)XK nuclease-like domain-containing protein n=1 Tax=Streptomyces albidoflavus TaxID=1886 RepID=UPI003D1283C2